MFRKILGTVSGLLLIAVFFAWLWLRTQDFFTAVVQRDSLLSLLCLGLAWLCLAGGAYILARTYPKIYSPSARKNSE